MDYEGKNKIFYIGSVVLFIVIILLYVSYFLFNKPTTNSTRKTADAVLVNNANEIDIVYNGEEIIEGVEETVVTPSKETKKKSNNQYKKVEIIEQAAEEMQDVIIDSTIYYTKK